MKDIILNQRNIGDQYQILYITDLLNKGSYPVQELKTACIPAGYSFSQSFDGVIAFMEWLGIVSVKEVVTLEQEISKTDFVSQICGLLFGKMQEEKELDNFLNHTNIEFGESIYIKNNLINIRFSQIRNFLLNIGFFQKDKLLSSQFFINPKFQDWFVAIVAPLIEQSKIKDKSLENLQEQLKNQVEMGRQAEEFVLAYEKSLRSGHANSQNIKIISEMDVGAGYDILSYQTDESKILDKYIEVKSYSREKRFFWSRNEMKVAQEKRDGYFLYLVNRDEMHLETYKPDIIQNPHQNVKESENWVGDCESWEFTVSSKGEGHR